MGPRLFLGERRRSRAGPPHQGSRASDRPQGADRPAAAPRHQPARPRPLHRHPRASPRRDSRRISGGDHAASVPRRLQLRLSDQGEPAATGRRGGPQFRQAVSIRPGGGLEAGAAGRHGPGRQRHADHLQRIQGRRIHRDGDAGPEDRPQHHPRRREIHGAGADSRGGREDRRPAADRHARQAGRHAAAAAGSRRADSAPSSA